MLHVVHRVARTVPTVFQVSVHYEPPLAKLESVDRDHHVSAAHERGRSRPAAVVHLVILGHGGMVAAEIDYLLLSEQEHAAVRVQIDNGGRAALETLRNMDIRCHAEIARGREQHPFPYELSQVLPVHYLGGSGHQSGLISQSIQYGSAARRPVFFERAKAIVQEGVRILITVDQTLDIRKQRSDVCAIRGDLARWIRRSAVLLSCHAARE